MRSPAIGRRTYALLMVVLLVGLPLAVGLSLYFFPEFESFGWVLPVIICVTAVLTSCRLLDAGYRWWIGAAILLIFLIGPALTILESMSLFRSRDRAHVPYIVIGVPLVIVLFAIWAGTRRTTAPSTRDRANLSDIFD